LARELAPFYILAAADVRPSLQKGTNELPGDPKVFFEVVTSRVWRPNLNLPNVLNFVKFAI